MNKKIIYGIIFLLLAVVVAVMFFKKNDKQETEKEEEKLPLSSGIVQGDLKIVLSEPKMTTKGKAPENTYNYTIEIENTGDSTLQYQLIWGNVELSAPEPRDDIPLDENGRPILPEGVDPIEGVEPPTDGVVELSSLSYTITNKTTGKNRPYSCKDAELKVGEQNLIDAIIDIDSKEKHTYTIVVTSNPGALTEFETTLSVVLIEK